MNRFSTACQQTVRKAAELAIATGLCLFSATAALSQEYTEFDSQYSSYYSTLSSKQATYYKYVVPAHTFGVFTLKNDSGRSDFDIAAYRYDSDNGLQLIDTQDNSGTQTELLIVQPSSRDRYIYLDVVNYGNASSQYRLYADYVSPMNKFWLAAARALVEGGFSAQENISERDASRLTTGLFSLFEGNGFAGVGKDMAINEITEEMRSQFGYGAMGDFIVDWSVSIVEGFYKNYF